MKKNLPRDLVLIWPNITAVVNAVFWDMLALTKVRYVINSKSVIVQKKTLVIRNIQIQIICGRHVLFGKQNIHANFIYMSHVTTNIPFLSY